MDVWTPVTIIGVPILRNAFGYLSVALKDGVLDRYEVKELLNTVFSMGLTGAVAYVGIFGPIFSSLGIDGAALCAAAVAWIVDRLIQ